MEVQLLIVVCRQTAIHTSVIGQEAELHEKSIVSSNIKKIIQF